jgi:DNA repair protein RadA/Sms
MKTKTIFVCQNCGAQAPRWIGKCPSCDSWNSYVEETAQAPAGGASEHIGGIVLKESPVLLGDIDHKDQKRFTTDIEELDRVLGGGIVPGSVTLIGGDPGIGKSTLSLQIACSLSQKNLKVLYVSGEESVQQTRMRSLRLNPKENKSLYIVNQVDLSVILEYIQKMKPDVVIVDSIQVVFTPDVTSTPGSVSQVRECAAILTHFVKSKGIALFVIGHVTKEGMLAGPRVLEHIVDTVLYFEGERYSSYRILRATKNRFGSTNEIGVFEMMSTGLIEVKNPSQIFLSERAMNSSGSVVVPIIEGTRPFLVEIQGLVSRSSFGMVRQKAQGFDANRLAMLVAVLEKRIGLNLYDKDIFLNVVGGVRIIDPAADLAVCMSIATGLLDKKVSSDTVVLGEIGLSAEVRSVSQITSRISEAQKLGFKKCILPKNNLKTKLDIKTKTIELIAVETLKDSLEHLINA